jgi:hypothetical protein
MIDHRERDRHLRLNIEHYMRFKDQMKAGADGQKRLNQVSDKD